MLSVTLFKIKIESIARLVPKDPRYTISLYVDYLQLS